MEYQRIDAYLTAHGLATGREKAKELIRSGAVTVNGRAVLKPSQTVLETDVVSVAPEAVPRYVSRGGIKLEGALSAFSVDVSGSTAVDIGASTGGFTDCLLQHGASKVYAVDCGSGQLAEKLRNDPRVVGLENCNARMLDGAMLASAAGKDSDVLCDLAVMDVSFISQTLLYPAVLRVLKQGGRLISLIKPQFEVGPSGLGKGGIVRNDDVRQAAVDHVLSIAAENGLRMERLISSPIEGGDGNKEYLALFCAERK